MMVEPPISVPTGLLAKYLSSIRPMVSVICISYNHERFIKAALESVLNQRYPAVELIVIDNGSSDSTAERIREVVRQHPEITFIANSENAGLCRAFNQGLKLATGRYVIDLSADDVLHPDRILRQVEAFERLPGDYAVVFTNAAFIDEHSQLRGYHFPIDQKKQSTVKVPSGWIFKDVLRSYFVCTPTMMMRKDILDSLGGYDETLSYEDFDFWVRTARNYRYHYQDEVLTSKRVLPHSLSAQVQQPDNTLLRSTLTICYKAFDQCQTPEEYRALADRIRVFIRKCFYAEQYELAFEFEKLLSYMEEPGWQTNMILQLCRWQLPINPLYRWYRRWRKTAPVV